MIEKEFIYGVWKLKQGDDCIFVVNRRDTNILVVLYPKIGGDFGVIECYPGSYFQSAGNKYFFEKVEGLMASSNSIECVLKPCSLIDVARLVPSYDTARLIILFLVSNSGAYKKMIEMGSIAYLLDMNEIEIS